MASRSDQTIYLHVVNTHRTRSVSSTLGISDLAVRKATAFQLADEPMVEVSSLNHRDVMQVKQSTLEPGVAWSFPAASVTAVEVELAA